MLKDLNLNKAHLFVVLAIVILVLGLAFNFQKNLMTQNTNKQDVLSSLGDLNAVATGGPTTRPTIPPTDKLIIRDLKPGVGAEVITGTTVLVHYVGALTDYKQFDNSYTNGKPFQMVVGEGKAIKGWDEGLIGMRVGGKRQLIIPPHMAYGDKGVPNIIPPNSTLIFEIELIDAKLPPPSPTPEPITPTEEVSPTPEE